MKRNNIVTRLMDMVPRRNKEGFDAKAGNAGPIMVLELDDYSDVYRFLRNHDVFGNIPGSYCDHFVDTLITNATLHHHTEPGIFGGTTLSYVFKFRIEAKPTGNGYLTPLSRMTQIAKTWLIMVDGVIDENISGNARDSRTITQSELLDEALGAPLMVLGLPAHTEYSNYNHEQHKLRVEA